MIEKYSKSKDGNKKLSNNFTVKEFACKDGSDYILIDTELVKILQKIREHFGKSVTINSAYRNAAYNKKVGGVSNSQHTKGTAADIVVNGVTPKEVAQYAEYLMPKSGGIGLYNGFTHIDTRSKRSRWQNFGKEVAVSGFPGYVHEFKEVQEIVDELHKRQIISNTALWRTKADTNSNAYWLARKGANMTKNASVANNLTSVNDIVWELNHRNIITDNAQWLTLLRTDTDLYWLAYKICNLTVNKGA